MVLGKYYVRKSERKESGHLNNLETNWFRKAKYDVVLSSMFCAS